MADLSTEESFKAQSTTEFLMTYGWPALIIRWRQSNTRNGVPANLVPLVALYLCRNPVLIANSMSYAQIGELSGGGAGYSTATGAVAGAVGGSGIVIISYVTP